MSSLNAPMCWKTSDMSSIRDTSHPASGPCVASAFVSSALYSPSAAFREALSAKTPAGSSFPSTGVAAKRRTARGSCRATTSAAPTARFAARATMPPSCDAAGGRGAPSCAPPPRAPPFDARGGSPAAAAPSTSMQTSRPKGSSGPDSVLVRRARHLRDATGFGVSAVAGVAATASSASSRRRRAMRPVASAAAGARWWRSLVPRLIMVPRVCALLPLFALRICAAHSAPCLRSAARTPAPAPAPAP